MHNHQPLDPKRVVSIDFGTYRLWDVDVTWPNLEPSKGQWQWGRLDAIMALARQRRWQVIMPLALSPRWASARPNENAFNDTSRLGWSAEPANISDWRNYVQTVATRYKGQAHIYEVWNEPDAPNFYTGDIPHLIALAREAYTILKAIDPNSTVISPPVVHFSGAGLDYLDRYLAQGGGGFADVIGYHFNIGAEPPERLPVHIAEVRQVMAKQGVQNKPLWNTEATWATVDITFPSADLQAAYVARAYILNWAAGVRQYDYYAWDNRGYPSIYMVESDLSTPTLAAKAYVEIRAWLLGSRMLSVTSDTAGNWTCTIARPDGTTARILWNPNASSRLDLPSDWRAARLRNLAGVSQDISSSQVTLGPSPVLVEAGVVGHAASVAVVSAASLTAGAVAPASLVSLFGGSLDAGPESSAYLPWFETLGGATVFVRDSAGATALAQLSYAGPGQVNFVFPSSSANGVATVTATGRDGSIYDASVSVAPAAPALFTAGSSGRGVAAAYASVTDSAGGQSLRYTFACGTPAGGCQPSAIPTAPAGGDSTLVLYGTGIRGASPGSVSVTLCGRTFAPSYAGPQPVYPGLDQINVALPASVRGCGLTTVQLTAGGLSANPVTVAIE